MAIHRINIVSGIQPDGPTNFLDCCQTCQTATVTFQNVHNSNLNINLFDIDDTSSGLSVNVTAINGGAVSWPFFIAQGDTFTLDIELCWDGVTTPLAPWFGKFNTVQHNNDLSWTFEMECVDWTAVWGPIIDFDFADTPVGSTNSQSVTLSNPTIGPVSISLDYSGCSLPEVIQSPTPAILPPGGTGVVTLIWSPTDIDDYISCSDLVFCGVGFRASGNAIAVPCDCLCCVDIQIQTDGNYLNTDVGFCEPDTVHSKSSFLDKKTVVFSMKYGNPIVTGWRLQFNPALFAPECYSLFDAPDQLPVGYFIQYLSGAHPDGTDQPMVLNGAASNALNLRNWDVRFRPTNAAAGEFNVEFTFYMVQDFRQFLDNITFDNSVKLKRNSIFAAADYDNTFPSVYNNPETLQAAFHVTDPATLVGDSFFRCGMTTCSSITSRFYNKGLNNGPSEFSNHSFTLSRDNGVVTNFSTIEKTKVQFSVYIPPAFGTSFPNIVFHLFNENGFNNSVDFLTATDSSRYLVATYSGAGVLDNHLVRPGAIGTSGANFIGSLYVATTIQPSTTYRMAAIVYSSNGEMVNTFLSDPIRVTQLPDMDCDCAPSTTSEFSQYWQKQTTECFRPVGKERIGHQLILSPSDFADCLDKWDLEIADWRTVLTSIRLNIYKRVEDYPNPGQTTFFQYETHQSVRNTAFPGNYQNFNDLVVQQSGPNDVRVYIKNRRVRWESVLFSGGQVLTANTNTYMNRTSAGPLASTYISALTITDSWINNDIFFEYVFTFDLSAYLGQPFIWNVVKAFKVNAIDFEPNNTGFETRLTDVTFEGQDPTTGLFVPIEEPICFSDWLSVRLTYQSTMEGNFLFFIEPEPFGLSVLQENDEVIGVNQMTQLMSPLVLSMDTVFDPVTLTASVVLDAPQFENKTYRFCGYISSPEVPPICEYFLYHSRNAGSTLIVVPTPQVGNTINGTFNNVTFGRSCVFRSSNGSTVYPIPGQTYYFEYSFSVPTTRPLDFKMGTIDSGDPTTFSIPVGSTSGSVYFTWGADTGGFWLFITGAGTNMTGTFAFKMGNQLCP